jgi:hypothetical protein
MAALYLDEDAPEDLASLLAVRGHFTVTTRAEGRKGAPDERQLWYAAEHRWTLITMNRRDYRLLHGAWLLWTHEWSIQSQHAGILILDHLFPVDVPRAVDAIHDLVHDVETRLQNSLYDWSRNAGWRR